MNAWYPVPLPNAQRLSATRSIANVRGQAAFVRTLLDEVERLVPPEGAGPLEDQLVEELARLGCRCIEIANALTAVIDAQERESEPVARCA